MYQGHNNGIMEETASQPQNKSEPTKSIYDVPMDLPDEQPKITTNGKPPKKRKQLIAIAVVVAMVIGGLAGWKLLSSRKIKSNPSPVQTTKQQQQSTQTTDVPDVTATKNYSNDPIGFKLTYPDSWTATDSEGGERFESPDFIYQTTNKGNVTGNFRIYIRKTARESDGKYIGRGLAIIPSEKLTYKTPLPGQRTDTLLSSFGLDATDNFAFFLIAGNFNLKKGDSLGPNYGKEADAFIIMGGYSAKDIKDDFATNLIPTTSYNQTKAYKQAMDILKSLKLS